MENESFSANWLEECLLTEYKRVLDMCVNVSVGRMCV